MADKEVRLIDANVLKSIIMKQVKECKIKVFDPSVNIILQDIENAPTIEAQTVKHGRWIMKEKTKLFPTGLLAVLEGRRLNKTSADKPFTEQEANIVRLKEHRTIKIPYCSICENYGDDEPDKTPFCPFCGARMDGDTED